MDENRALLHYFVNDLDRPPKQLKENYFLRFKSIRDIRKGTVLGRGKKLDSWKLLKLFEFARMNADNHHQIGEFASHTTKYL